MSANNGQGKMRRILIGILDFLSLGSSVMLRRQGPLRDAGWFRSYQERQPVDAKGEPIPWLPYRVIDSIATRISSNLDVFEYGCGNTTLRWARRVRQVISVNSLTECGVIILDNSNREDYRAAILVREQAGFRHLDICGLVPVVAWKDQTSICYRAGNCLGI